MDGMQPNDGSMGQDQQGGYCIEIYIGANGQPTSVNVETMDDEGAEEQGSGMQGMDQGDMDGQGAGESDKGVPVGSLEEAMSMVKQIVQNQGSMPDGSGGQDDGSAEDQMMQGYGKGGVGARRSGLPVRKVFSGGM